ncbi:MAG: T9SS type A sorting domain-containing protein [Paludibacter sp.]
MNKITRFFLLAVAIAASTNLGFAAKPAIDFETVGNSWTWSVFENNPTWSVVANPSITGINTSANVGKLVIKNTDQPWAGVQCAKGDFGPYTISAGNSTIKIMVYKDVISPVGIKLVTAVDASKGEIKVSNTKINEWEELTFDFSSQIDNGFIYTGIVFFTDFPANRSAGSTTYIDNVIYDTSVPDTAIPTAFTATKGTVGTSSVELLLNATDNSGAVTYEITSGTHTVSTTGTSGVQKSYIISGLTPSTAYSFSIVAKDASGNVATINPIVIDATTLVGVANTECNGAETQSVDGSAFTLGYNYTFATVGTDVTVTFECLDTKDGLVAYLWNRTSGFSETSMTKTSGQIFTKTLTGQTPGATITVACKFAFAGGMSVTKDFTYTVGNSCTAGPADTEVPTAFTATKGAVSSSTVELLLTAADNSGAVVFDITYGTTTVSTNSASTVQKSFIVTGLDAATAYNFSVVAKDVTGNALSAIIVNATTSAAMQAATTPTRAANKVISLYSDTYTSSTIAWDNWGSATALSEVLLGTSNNTKKFVNFGWYGMNFSAIDISNMANLHIDVYPTTETVIKITPIGGGETLVTLNVIANQWNSIDLALTQFPGITNKSNVNQFKFADGTGGTFYMDNLYFYNDNITGLMDVASVPSINCYPNPALNELTVSAQSEINEVTVRNLVGQSIRNVIVNGKTKTIDLSGLAAGNYFIVAKMSNGQITNQKFSKN